MRVGVRVTSRQHNGSGRRWVLHPHTLVFPVSARTDDCNVGRRRAPEDRSPVVKLRRTVGAERICRARAFHTKRAMSMMRRRVRRAWQIGRWALVAVLLPLVIALHAAVVVVVVRPFNPADLAATSAPLTLVDIRGEPLATFAAQGADRLHWTRLGDLSAIAVSAVIESEDEHFWRHRGVDGAGVARAAWLDLHGGRFGGSTLTMQLARMMISDGRPRTLSAKLREALLALRIERAVDKRTILEQWMNRAYFGNGAHGFEAAAQLYFGKPASALSNA